MKRAADWYTKGRIERDVMKHVREKVAPRVRADMQRLIAASQARQNEAWRNKRLGRVQPIQMDGLFIAKEVQPGVLVLGFREGDRQHAVGFQMISFNSDAKSPTDHSISPYIGKYARITVEEIK